MNLIHRGNANLKSIGVPVEFSKDDVAEYYKCSQDPIYFIKNYIKIISLDLGLIPFKLFDYQVRFILSIHENRRVISMQPRQSGKTQCVAAYIIWYTIFNDNKQVAILANKASAAKEIMDRYQKMYEHLPNWLQQGVKTWNKQSIELENGSKAYTAATNGSAVTGKSINFLYIDEAAVISNTVAEDFFTSAYPTISSGKNTKIVLTSTPRGYNHFWKLWSEAEDRENTGSEFIPIRVHYWEHPSRDDAWAKEQLELLKELKFNQEILCAFLGSSLTLIGGDHIAKFVPSRPISSTDGLDILDRPKIGNTYIMVVDTSEGVGGDYSAFTVMDVTELPYTVVAKYRSNSISPLLYPTVIYQAAKVYNDAFLLMEINRSEQVAYIMQSEYEYDNILYVTRSKRGGQMVTGGFGTGTQAYGVATDKRVKRIGCANLKTLIETNKLLITDADIISEISTFVEKRASYGADDGYHDDLVMTLVLFGWLTTQDYFKNLLNVDIRKSLFDARQRQIEEQIAPIGIRVDGNEDSLIVPEVIAGDYWFPVQNEEF